MTTPRRLRKKPADRGIQAVLKFKQPLTLAEVHYIQSKVQEAKRLGLPLIVGPDVDVIDLGARQ